MNELGHFEQNLLTELREVVAEQARAPQPRRTLPYRRLTLAAAGAGLLAAGLLVGVPALDGDQTPAAYAVTTNADGTITVTLNDVNDTEAAEGLERELEARGVAAEIDYVPGGKVCRDSPASYAGAAGVDVPNLVASNETVMVLRPAVIEGRTVVVEITLAGTFWKIGDDAPESYFSTFRVGLAEGPVPACVLVDEPVR